MQIKLKIHGNRFGKETGVEMKEYKFYACSRYVFYFYVSLFAVALMWAGLILPSKNEIITKIIYLFVMLSVVAIDLFLIVRGSFSRIYVTEEGIGNKHLFFTWSAIETYTLCEIIYNGRIPKKFFPMIVCIGAVSSNNFRYCSPKKAVCFSLTKKNLKIIEEMCKEKNETMRELLSWSNFPIKKW